MASRVSNLETIAWQQQSIVRSNLGNIFESRWSNAIWLVTVERSKSLVRETNAFFKICCTVVFKKVATFNIDFASRDGNRTHQNVSKSCDSNFVCKTIEIEQIKNFRIQIERTLLRCKKSLAMS